MNLKNHAAHGDIFGEWTTPTYAHAGGGSGHIWRPIPASLQHLCAILWGRTPSMFRGLNLFIHLFNLGLFAWFCRDAKPKFAAALIIVWATHPVLPERLLVIDICDLLMARIGRTKTLPTQACPDVVFCAMLSKEVALAVFLF